MNVLTVLPSTTTDTLTALAPLLRAADNLLTFAAAAAVVVELGALVARRRNTADRASRWFRVAVMATVALGPVLVAVYGLTYGWVAKETVGAAVSTAILGGYLWFTSRDGDLPFVVTAELRGDGSRWPRWRTIRFRRVQDGGAS